MHVSKWKISYHSRAGEHTDICKHLACTAVSWGFQQQPHAVIISHCESPQGAFLQQHQRLAAYRPAQKDIKSCVFIETLWELHLLILMKGKIMTHLIAYLFITKIRKYIFLINSSYLDCFWCSNVYYVANRLPMPEQHHMDTKICLMQNLENQNSQKKPETLFETIYLIYLYNQKPQKSENI